MVLMLKTSALRYSGPPHGGLRKTASARSRGATCRKSAWIKSIRSLTPYTAALCCASANRTGSMSTAITEWRHNTKANKFNSTSQKCWIWHDLEHCVENCCTHVSRESKLDGVSSHATEGIDDDQRLGYSLHSLSNVLGYLLRGDRKPALWGETTHISRAESDLFSQTETMKLTQCDRLVYRKYLLHQTKRWTLALILP